MLRRKERSGEKGRDAARIVFSRLDAMEARELEYRRISEAGGESAARARFPRPTPRELADEVQELAVVCDRNVNTLLGAVAAWAESREGRLTGHESEHRALGAIHLGVIRMIGNLFGQVAKGSPSFDAELAAEGRRRGWR